MQAAPAPADDSAPIEPSAYQAMLGRGMDVDWVKTGPGRRGYDEATARAFRGRGLSHVRIRVTEETHADDLRHLSRVVSDCLANGLIPIVAFQAEYFKLDPSPENVARVAQWWRSVARTFRSTSRRLSFDLLIEATDELNGRPEALNELFEKATSEIRAEDPTRIVMISPRLRSDPQYLGELKIPTAAGKYLMAEWHFYASGPSRTNPRKSWTNGSAAEKRLITDPIQSAIAWQRRTGVPTWVGAWMPGVYAEKSAGDDYTTAEEVKFATFVTCELTRAGVPFAVNADHHFYDAERRRWVDERAAVLDAILSTQCGGAAP